MDAKVGGDELEDVLGHLDDLLPRSFASDGARLVDGENRSVLDDSLVEWWRKGGLFFGSYGI